MHNFKVSILRYGYSQIWMDYNFPNYLINSVLSVKSTRKGTIQVFLISYKILTTQKNCTIFSFDDQQIESINECRLN